MRHAQAGFEFHGPGIPRSSFYNSPFGRMFSKIEPWEPESDITSEVRASFDAYAADHMTDDGDPAGDNIHVPAGYTYFGQFVDHDITFDPTTSLMRHNDPNKHRNFRTPRLDLDSVYGAGPDASPHLYTNFGYFLIGRGVFKAERDLPRNANGTALIGDPRNDENTIVSQVQLAFLLFHNKTLATIVGDDTTQPTAAQFRQAQRIVRWTYQYIVWNDFVKRLVSKSVWEDVISKDDLGKLKARRLYYTWKQSPYIPVEFSVAAYRLGHAMVRNDYEINQQVGIGVRKPIFALGGDTDSTLDLRGGQPLRDHHSIQWDWFLDFAPVDPNNRGQFPQLARKFNRKLGAGVHDIPTPDGPTHLGVLNLLRSWRMGLPSGSAVAKYMGITNAMAPVEATDDCLWPYILKEAELPAGAGGSGIGGNGTELGSVGSRIVAEVFAGLLLGDPASYMSLEPEWTPADDLLPLFGAGPIHDDWTLSDIVSRTGLPITGNDIVALDQIIDLTDTGVVVTAGAGD